MKSNWHTWARSLLLLSNKNPAAASACCTSGRNSASTALHLWPSPCGSISVLAHCPKGVGICGVCTLQQAAPQPGSIQAYHPSADAAAELQHALVARSFSTTHWSSRGRARAPAARAAAPSRPTLSKQATKAGPHAPRSHSDAHHSRSRPSSCGPRAAQDQGAASSNSGSTHDAQGRGGSTSWRVRPVGEGAAEAGWERAQGGGTRISSNSSNGGRDWLSKERSSERSDGGSSGTWGGGGSSRGRELLFRREGGDDWLQGSSGSNKHRATDGGERGRRQDMVSKFRAGDSSGMSRRPWDAGGSSNRLRAIDEGGSSRQQDVGGSSSSSSSSSRLRAIDGGASERQPGVDNSSSSSRLKAAGAGGIGGSRQDGAGSGGRSEAAGSPSGPLQPEPPPVNLAEKWRLASLKRKMRKKNPDWGKRGSRAGGGRSKISKIRLRKLRKLEARERLRQHLARAHAQQEQELKQLAQGSQAAQPPLLASTGGSAVVQELQASLQALGECVQEQQSGLQWYKRWAREHQLTLKEMHQRERQREKERRARSREKLRARKEALEREKQERKRVLQQLEQELRDAKRGRAHTQPQQAAQGSPGSPPIHAPRKGTRAAAQATQGGGGGAGMASPSRQRALLAHPAAGPAAPSAARKFSTLAMPLSPPPLTPAPASSALAAEGTHCSLRPPPTLQPCMSAGAVSSSCVGVPWQQAPPLVAPADLLVCSHPPHHPKQQQQQQQQQPVAVTTPGAPRSSRLQSPLAALHCCAPQPTLPPWMAGPLPAPWGLHAPAAGRKHAVLAQMRPAPARRYTAVAHNAPTGKPPLPPGPPTPPALPPLLPLPVGHTLPAASGTCYQQPTASVAPPPTAMQPPTTLVPLGPCSIAASMQTCSSSGNSCSSSSSSSSPPLLPSQLQCSPPMLPAPSPASAPSAFSARGGLRGPHGPIPCTLLGAPSSLLLPLQQPVLMLMRTPLSACLLRPFSSGRDPHQRQPYDYDTVMVVKTDLLASRTLEDLLAALEQHEVMLTPRTALHALKHAGKLRFLELQYAMRGGSVDSSSRHRKMQRIFDLLLPRLTALAQEEGSHRIIDALHTLRKLNIGALQIPLSFWEAACHRLTTPCPPELWASQQQEDFRPSIHASLEHTREFLRQHPDRQLQLLRVLLTYGVGRQEFGPLWMLLSEFLPSMYEGQSQGGDSSAVHTATQGEPQGKRLRQEAASVDASTSIIGVHAGEAQTPFCPLQVVSALATVMPDMSLAWVSMEQVTLKAVRQGLLLLLQQQAVQEDPSLARQLDAGLVLLEAWRRSGAGEYLRAQHKFSRLQRTRRQTAKRWQRLHACVQALYRPPGTPLHLSTQQGSSWEGALWPLLLHTDDSQGLGARMQALRISWTTEHVVYDRGVPLTGAQPHSKQQGKEQEEAALGDQLRTQLSPELQALRMPHRLRLAPFAATVLEEPTQQAALLHSLNHVLRKVEAAPCSLDRVAYEAAMQTVQTVLSALAAKLGRPGGDQAGRMDPRGSAARAQALAQLWERVILATRRNRLTVTEVPFAAHSCLSLVRIVQLMGDPVVGPGGTLAGAFGRSIVQLPASEHHATVGPHGPGWGRAPREEPAPPRHSTHSKHSGTTAGGGERARSSSSSSSSSDGDASGSARDGSGSVGDGTAGGAAANGAAAAAAADAAGPAPALHLGSAAALHVGRVMDILVPTLLDTWRANMPELRRHALRVGEAEAWEWSFLPELRSGLLGEQQERQEQAQEQAQGHASSARTSKADCIQQLQQRQRQRQQQQLQLYSDTVQLGHHPGLNLLFLKALIRDAVYMLAASPMAAALKGDPAHTRLLCVFALCNPSWRETDAATRAAIVDAIADATLHYRGRVSVLDRLLLPLEPSARSSALRRRIVQATDASRPRPHAVYEAAQGTQIDPELAQREFETLCFVSQAQSMMGHLPHHTTQERLLEALVVDRVLQPVTTASLLRSPAFVESGVASRGNSNAGAGAAAGPDAPYVRVLLPLLQEWAESKALPAAHEQQQQQLQPQQGPRQGTLCDVGSTQALSLLQALHLSPEVQAQCDRFGEVLWVGSGGAAAEGGGEHEGRDSAN